MWVCIYIFKHNHTYTHTLTHTHTQLMAWGGNHEGQVGVGRVDQQVIEPE